MKYLLLVCGEEDPAGEIQPEPGLAGQNGDDGADEPCWMPWHREMTALGIGLLTGSRLQPVRTATTVRTDGNEVLVADGPFAETKEQILGFDVIECRDLDEAIFVASRHPATLSGGVVEVRPLLES